MLRVASINIGSGGGHLFGGLALWEAFKRHLEGSFQFYLLTDATIDVPIADERLEMIQILMEPEKYFFRDRETMLYQYLKHLDPEVIIVDHIWLPLRPILQDFQAKKIIFFRYMPPEWFQTPPIDDEILCFEPKEYDLAFTMDPGFTVPGCTPVNPVVNILPESNHSRDVIRSVLQVPDDKKLALIAHNGMEGEIENILEEADINQDEYCLRTLNSFDHEVSQQIFPLAHYMSGVDLAIGGCGYNFFYETKALGIKTLYFPQPRMGNEQHWRLEHCLNYDGPYDGADQMVALILASL